MSQMDWHKTTWHCHLLGPRWWGRKNLVWTASSGLKTGFGVAIALCFFLFRDDEVQTKTLKVFNDSFNYAKVFEGVFASTCSCVEKHVCESTRGHVVIGTQARPLTTTTVNSAKKFKLQRWSWQRRKYLANLSLPANAKKIPLKGLDDVVVVVVVVQVLSPPEWLI